VHPFRFCGEETPYLMARSLLELGYRAGMKPAALMPADDNAADLFPRRIDLILTPVIRFENTPTYALYRVEDKRPLPNVNECSKHFRRLGT
jgi:hypothetical protein